MYETFFGLQEKPFSLLPDPRFLFPSRSHAMAMHMLEYGLAEQAGYVVLTGEVGTGKTTLLRHLLHSVDRTMVIGLVTNTHASFGELMKWILLAFDLDYREQDAVEQHRRFTDFLIAQYAQGLRVVLIVDEAQNLARDTLEQLRMLSNINSEADQLLQIILVGQPELRQMLEQPELRQFVQRISIDYHLDPLNGSETTQYIRHRMEVAGGNRDAFSDDACLAVTFFAKGLPRLINSLCDLALVYAFAEDQETITADIILDVISTRMAGGLAGFRQPPEGLGRDELLRLITEEPTNTARPIRAATG